MPNYAVIDKDENIINIIVWDGETEWAPPEGTIVVKVDDSEAGIGWTYKEGVFNSRPTPELYKEDLVIQAEQQKANLILEASQNISIYQDAVDLDMETDDEIIQLMAWKKYRVLLNRVDSSASQNIAWPTKP